MRQSLAQTYVKTGEVQLTERQRTIVHAAALLFDQKGYHQTSMEDLAESIGLSKPTLYHYFSGKADLLFWIHHELIERLIAREEAMDSSMSPLERLTETIHASIESTHTHQAYMRVFHAHSRELPSELREFVHGRRDVLRHLVERIIVDGVADGSFRAVDPTLASFAVLGMANWTHRWYRPDGRLSHNEIAAFQAELVIRGLRVDSGAAVASSARDHAADLGDSHRDARAGSTTPRLSGPTFSAPAPG